MPYKRQDHMEMYEYYLTKKTLKEVGIKFGLTRERIRQIFELEKYEQRKYRIVNDREYKNFIDVDELRFYLKPNARVGGAYTCSQNNMKGTVLQNYLWKKFYRASCPKHCVVIFKDGNPRNIKKSNLKLRDKEVVQAVVTPEMAKKIRKAYASGKYAGYRTVGLHYNIGTMTVWKVVNRKGYYGRI